MSMLRELENLLQEITDQGSAKGKGRPQQGRPQQNRPPARQPPIEYLDAEIVEAEPVREGVAEHVKHHLDTDDVTSRASQLGVAAGQADDRLEAHIHDKFDHDLSKIDDRLGTDDEVGGLSAGKPVASELAEMLRSPKSIRQAVILSEILNRPHA